MKGMKTAVHSFAGLVLLAFVVLGAFAYFTTSVPLATFGALAFILATLALVVTYFGWMAPRLAGLYVAIAALLVVGVMFGKMPKVKSSGYQAVFLTNNQVYFGHLENPESRTPVLKDVYYLQSNQQQNPQSGSSTQASLSLVKLGNEIHGPEDAMALKADQILFWENLKDNGKVVQAIKQNQQKK